MQYRNWKNPDSAILLNYNDHEYSQGYCQIEEAFRAVTKYDISQPYLFANDGSDIGYIIYVSDIRYQKKPRSCSTKKSRI